MNCSCTSCATPLTVNYFLHARVITRSIFFSCSPPLLKINLFLFFFFKLSWQ
jgi:hypothetical protein